MKFIGVKCDVCGIIGPGTTLKWLDWTDKNAEIQNVAKARGWAFVDFKDRCPDCLEVDIDPEDLKKISFQRSKFAVTHESKEAAKRRKGKTP